MTGTRRTRVVSWDDPASMPARGATRSGIEVLRGVLSGEFASSPMTELVGAQLVEAEPGRVVFEATPLECHYNPTGVVHGGFAATLLDSAMGCAAYSTVGPGQVSTTLELKVSYLAAITLDTGRVRAIGTVLRRGRSAVFAEGRLEDVAGTLLAHATTTCLIRELPPR